MPLKVIKQATNSFAPENCIGEDRSGMVYKGKLLRPKGFVTVAFRRLRTDLHEATYMNILHLSKYRHENILPLVGFSDERGEKIFVYEFLTNGSLDKHLNNDNLSWSKRLQICLDVARGLNHLHNPPGYVVRYMKSANILLDTNWTAKIDLFGISNKDLPDLPNEEISIGYTMQVSNAAGTIGYVDPEYLLTGILTKASDIYSFGVVLFEVLCGRLAVKDYRDIKYLPAMVQEHYKKGTITEIIDPILRKRMDSDSLNAFTAIAYQCLERDGSKRPTSLQVAEKLEQVLRLRGKFEKALEQTIEFQHWKIPLEEIRLATNGFHSDCLIGGGGFGGVYKAELFHFDFRSNQTQGHHNPRIKSKVAIKKLDTRYGQGREQFLQEIKVLCGLQHQNLVSLLGFCHEDNDMILVYEHASNGSLDRCIRNFRRVYNLTWVQRLQICLDVCNGLNYLHDIDIIHRDIKSSNILLGQNWDGMIGDFGLSRKRNHPEQEFSKTSVAGTSAYVDPRYARTGELTKQSDIYSFGVVLLEVLYGRLAVFPRLGDEPEYLVHTFKGDFLHKKLHQNIDLSVFEEFQTGSPHANTTNILNSIYKFAEVAYKCLFHNQGHHLTMAKVEDELKKARELIEDQQVKK